MFSGCARLRPNDRQHSHSVAVPDWEQYPYCSQTSKTIALRTIAAFPRQLGHTLIPVKAMQQMPKVSTSLPQMPQPRNCYAGSQVHDIDPEFPSDVTEKWGKYKNYNDWARSQTRHAFRPRIDPKHMSIIIFPGQGAQFVGMASKLLDYPNVGEMFKVASEVLQYDLLDVCLNGPKEKLDKTIYCQPAILVTSLAAVEKLKDEKPWVGAVCVVLVV